MKKDTSFEVSFLRMIFDKMLYFQSNNYNTEESLTAHS